MTNEEALAKLHENIESAKRRQMEEERAKAKESLEHPAPPHPDEEWRARGRRVFIRMLRFGFENAPWHHRDAYDHAAMTSEGRIWLEHEIAYWEERMSWHEKQVIATRKRAPLPDDESPLDRRKKQEQEDDWAVVDDSPISKQLAARERAEDDEGFGRTARVDSRAIERRDARRAHEETKLKMVGGFWARRDLKSKIHAYDSKWRSMCGASVLMPEQQAKAIRTGNAEPKCARCELIINDRNPYLKKPTVMK